MAHVRRLPSGRFRAVWWDKLNHRKAYETLPAAVKSKAAALRIARRLELAHFERTRGLSKSPDSTAWILMASLVQRESETVNRKSWQASINGFVDRLKADLDIHTPLSDVDITWARQFLTSCQSERREKSDKPRYSPETLRKALAFYRRVWARGIEAGLCRVNPWLAVPSPRVEKRPPAYLTRQEFARLVKAAPVDRRFRYWMLVSTGARQIEAWALTWADFDSRRRTVALRTAQKGRGSSQAVRVIPIADPLLSLLRARRGPDSEPVFSQRENWLRDFKLDCRKAGILLGARSSSRNILRHTFCSWLIQAGEPVPVIQQLAGHSSIETTMIYAHLAPGVPRQIVRAFRPLWEGRKKKAASA